MVERWNDGMEFTVSDPDIDGVGDKTVEGPYTNPRSILVDSLRLEESFGVDRGHTSGS